MFEFLRLNLKAFFSKEEGVSSLEYAILAVVIIGVVVAVLVGNGDGAINKLFSNMSSVLDSAATGTTGTGGTGGTP